MSQSDLAHAQKAMQEQWYNLIAAEQQGRPFDVLEHMYDRYVLLAQEYNHCLEALQQEHHGKLNGASAPKRQSTCSRSSSEKNQSTNLLNKTGLHTDLLAR